MVLAIEQTIATFFSHIMSAIGGNSAGPGLVSNCFFFPLLHYILAFPTNITVYTRFAPVVDISIILGTDPDHSLCVLDE